MIDDRKKETKIHAYPIYPMSIQIGERVYEFKVRSSMNITYPEYLFKRDIEKNQEIIAAEKKEISETKTSCSSCTKKLIAKLVSKGMTEEEALEEIKKEKAESKGSVPKILVRKRKNETTSSGSGGSN